MANYKDKYIDLGAQKDSQLIKMNENLQEKQDYLIT